MQLSARTQRTDDEDDSSNTQQSNGGPKRHPSFHYAQVMDRPGNLVKPSQALYDFVLRAELWEYFNWATQSLLLACLLRPRSRAFDFSLLRSRRSSKSQKQDRKSTRLNSSHL